MSYISQIGKVSAVNWKFQWTINNFLASTEENTMYRSPNFKAGDTVWFLKIAQGRGLGNNREEYVSLYLFGERIEKHMTIHFKLGIKTVNHADVNVHESDWNPNGEDDWGWTKFIKRSDLESRESELMPFGSLTVTCSIKMKNNVPNFGESKSLVMLSVCHN